MNWQKIKKECPMFYASYLEDFLYDRTGSSEPEVAEHSSNINTRDLYDLLDKIGCHVSVNYEREYPGFAGSLPYTWSIDLEYDNSTQNKQCWFSEYASQRFDTRKETEEFAFETAIYIIEEKLERHLPWR